MKEMCKLGAFSQPKPLTKKRSSERILSEKVKYPVNINSQKLAIKSENATLEEEDTLKGGQKRFRKKMKDKFFELFQKSISGNPDLRQTSQTLFPQLSRPTTFLGIRSS